MSGVRRSDGSGAHGFIESPNLRIASRAAGAFVLAATVASTALADTGSPAKEASGAGKDALPPPRGGEHPGFRKWVRRQAAARKATLLDWWSADLDNDQEADNVANLCTPVEGETEMFTTWFLVEDARGRHFVAAIPDGNMMCGAGCVAPDKQPPFRQTAERVVVHSPCEKRSHDDDHLALRDGRLVVVAERHGSFHLPEFTDDFDLDWERLELHELHRRNGNFDDKDRLTSWGSERERQEAVLLVTAPGVVTPTHIQLVRGEGVWRGAEDASFRVQAWQPGAHRLVVRVALVDDALVPASTATEEALAAADHLQVWIGSRSLRLARRTDGTWFALPGAKTTAKEAARAQVKGDGAAVEITLPLAWPGLRENAVRWEQPQGEDGEPQEPQGPAGEPPVKNNEPWFGSLVVAFADVDAPGDGARKVVATAPVPQKGEPHGILVKLPRAARWPATQSRPVSSAP